MRGCYRPGEDNPFCLGLECEDNSVLVCSPEGKVVSTIYPPPTAKEVIAVEYCRSLNKFFVLLVTGTICVYRFDKETAILELIQYPN